VLTLLSNNTAEHCGAARGRSSFARALLLRRRIPMAPASNTTMALHNRDLNGKDGSLPYLLFAPGFQHQKVRDRTTKRWYAPS